MKTSHLGLDAELLWRIAVCVNLLKILGNYIRPSTKCYQLKIFQSVNIFFAKWNSFFSIQEFLFHKENFFSQTARCSPTPMSLGSSASFRRIVPSRDTSTTESEIPSFRDAKPKQSVLAPRRCEERSDVAILSAGKDCFTPPGFAMTVAFKYD